MCQQFGVSPAGYYAWRKRGPSKHDQDDTALTTKIKAIFDAHKGRYGVRRIFADLRRQGVRVAYKRVQRLMPEAGLVSVHPRRRHVTTVQAAEPSSLPDLVRRDFTATRPNEIGNALSPF